MYGDEDEEKVKTKGDGEADDDKDADVDGQAGTEDADDDGAGEHMAAKQEPDVETEASLAAGAAVPSWAPRDISCFLGPPHRVWISLQSRSDRT